MVEGSFLNEGWEEREFMAQIVAGKTSCADALRVRWPGRAGFPQCDPNLKGITPALRTVTTAMATAATENGWPRAEQKHAFHETIL